MKRILLGIGATLLLPACATNSTEPCPDVALQAPGAEWRALATEGDRARLRGWREAWTEALEKAAAGGKGAELAAEGGLLQPDSAIGFEAPPTGDYRCRTIKVGAKSEGLLDYVAYPWFECRIRAEGGELRFEKLTGSQRPVGRLFTDRDRLVFLGTLQLGDERRALDYGHDAERDMAAVLQRIGERRWRLVFPYPAFESTIDIVELVPASAPL